MRTIPYLVIRLFLIILMIPIMTSCFPSECGPETFVRVEGRVMDFSGHGVSNAEVTIQSSSGRLSTCSDSTQGATLQVMTDAEGNFDTGYSAQDFLEFTMTISAEGCQTYHHEDIFFGIFRTAPDDTTIFLITCHL